MREGVRTRVELLHRYKFCMLMVMETVGKIEILFIIHSAQVWFFPSCSLFFRPYKDYLQGFVFSSRQCIPYTQENNNTNNRSENIYVFTSKHLQLKRGELYVLSSSSWKIFPPQITYTLSSFEAVVQKTSTTRSSIF